MSLRGVSAPLLLAVVLGLALAWPLHSPPVAHHGEAREGLVVQSVVDRGEWILPRRNGEMPSKPPLFHWLAGTAARGLGLSDGVLRLPSAIAAWGVACCTVALGCAMGGPTTGWLAVGALLGMVPFLTSASEARVDMVFTACTTAALTGFFFWYRDRSAPARALLYAAASAAVLAKGPIGAVLPGVVIVGFLLVQGELRLLGELWSAPLMALAALVDLGWYALATTVGGREFLALQLFRENWSRLVGNEEFRRTAHGHTLRLPGLLVTQFLPWTAALVWCVVRRARGVRLEVSERFLHVWWMAVLGLFTLAAGKRPVYLLPAAPAVALLAGRLLTAVSYAPIAAPSANARVRWQVPLARLAVALVIFDVGALVTLQVIRESKARRRSLVPFADKVAHLVPGDQPLSADASIRPSDRMVLAYRLRRSLRHGAAAPGLPYLAAAGVRRAQWCDGAALLAESGDGADDVALLRAPASGPVRRPDEICREADAAPAGAAAASSPGGPHRAESGRRLLLPLGDPAPAPTP